MPAGPSDLSGRTLLAIFAHPDDESVACGGLLVRWSSAGGRVIVLSLTHGEHGPRAGGGDAAETVRDLRDVRLDELNDAARILGVTEAIALDYEDGMLPWVDAALVEADIVRAIQRFAPDSVVTFDEDGLYWHPDHIAVHQRTLSAIASLGVSAPALYYVTVPQGAMRQVFDAAGRTAKAIGAPPPQSILGIADPDAFGADAPAPTVILEAGDVASRKLAAIRCHRSQLEGDAFTSLTAEDATRAIGTEHYRRSEVGSPGSAWLERLADTTS